MIKKTVIIAGYRCNNQCRFCIDCNKRDLAEKSTAQIIADMRIARKSGSCYLELIGGELTIRKDIFYILSSAKKIGFETVAMATNGRMFSYYEFCQELVATGIDHLIFSIHGPNAQIHDYLTQSKGSFQQLLEGLDNLRELKFRNIGSNTTIVKKNYRYLPQIGKFIYDRGIHNAEFIFVDPSYGGACDHFNELVPTLSECCGYIRKCLDIGKEYKLPHWAVRYVPLCFFLGYQDQVSELLERANVKTEHIAVDFLNRDVTTSRAKIGRIKPIICKGCKVFDLCEGLWRKYYRRYGAKELKPVK